MAAVHDLSPRANARWPGTRRLVRSSPSGSTFVGMQERGAGSRPCRLPAYDRCDDDCSECTR